VLDPAQDGHDFLGTEIGVQQIERDDPAQCPVRLLEPSPGLVLRSQHILGDGGHACQTQQPIRLVRSEASLLLPPGQGAGRQADNPRQRGGDVVALPTAAGERMEDRSEPD
jgi:hypothetical protein